MPKSNRITKRTLCKECRFCLFPAPNIDDDFRCMHPEAVRLHAFNGGEKPPLCKGINFGMCKYYEELETGA